MKDWLICIDDTDDIGTKGTGEIASEIAELLTQQGGQTSLVTRHQLYVHPDIPYTSHNSAMCFGYRGELTLEAIREVAIAHLLRESASAADPGLALLSLADFSGQDALMAFGREAKQEVKTKEQAYGLAEHLGISLSEHGGTGQGVIGALAGLGLRLTGNDGRVKGQLKFGQTDEAAPFSVADILNRSELDGVLTTDGEWLQETDTVWLGGKVKAVWAEHNFALLVSKRGAEWHNAGKQQLKEF